MIINTIMFNWTSLLFKGKPYYYTIKNEFMLIYIYFYLIISYILICVKQNYNSKSCVHKYILSQTLVVVT